MRANRTYGSEGGEASPSRPLSGLRPAACESCCRQPTQKPVTGEIELTLYKGNLRVSSRTSPYSLYDDAIASMEAGGSYNQTDAEGFLRIMGLPHRVQGRVRPRGY